MNTIEKIYRHLKLVHNHRKLVFKLCCKAGIPIQGLMHDLSKYTISELKESIKYFNGKKSPLAVCKKYQGYSNAWNHHKGRNKHHFEYYIDLDSTNRTPIMPYKYTVEMICDVLAAGKTYMGYDWTPKAQLETFYSRRDLDYINPKIFHMIERVYIEIDKKGLDATINKKNLKKIYNEEVLSKYKYTVYLGGTCGTSTWRDDLIKLFDKDLQYFNPLTKVWNHDVERENNKIKRDSKYILYVVTCETKGMLSIAHLINAANKFPDRTLVCFLRKGFTKNQIISIEEIERLVERNRCKYFDNLKDLADFLNANKE